MNRYIIRRFFAFDEIPADYLYNQYIQTRVTQRLNTYSRLNESTEDKFWRLWKTNIYNTRGKKQYIDDSYDFMCAKTEYHKKTLIN